MIKALHMDDRLIHGQVAISWTRSVDANVILVISDTVVNDNMRKMALKMAVPPAVKYGFRSVEDGIAFLQGPESAKYKILALVDDPIAAAKVALAEKDSITRLTVGGIRKDAPHYYSMLNLTDEDVAALLSISDAGIPVEYLPTPADKAVNLEPYLRKGAN